jgi:hypothetical protein
MTETDPFRDGQWRQLLPYGDPDYWPTCVKILGPIVRELEAMGLAQDEIAAEFNAHQIPTPGAARGL